MTTPNTDGTAGAGLRALIAKIRQRQCDFENSTVWESDARWHANEFRAWADELEAALSALPDVGEVDNGNIFVFCDYVSHQYGGCIRGAGHSVPHIFNQRNIVPPLAPVVVESHGEATPPEATDTAEEGR